MDRLPGPDWLIWLAGAATLASILYRPLIRPAWRFVARIAYFLEDWGGRPARPGHDAVPGIPEQIQQLTAGQAALKEQIRVNGTGHSIGDTVAELKVGQAEAKTAALEAKQAASEAKIAAADLDARVTPWLEYREDQLETYRASLVEIAYIDPDIARRDPHRRDRKADREDS